MKPLRVVVIVVVGLVLAGCAPAPEPDDEVLERFGAALAEELQGIDELQMNPQADQGELVDRVAGLSVVDDVFVDDSSFETLALAATSVTNGAQTVLSSAVSIDDWSLISSEADAVIVSYDLHFTRELAEIDGDAWEEVIPYEVTFDHDLTRVTSIVIRDVP